MQQQTSGASIVPATSEWQAHPAKNLDAPEPASSNGHRSTRRRKPDKGAVVLIEWAKLLPSPENDDLYGKINPEDEDIKELADKIAIHGIIEPIVVTLDGYIVSGHRRWWAAYVAGLTHVPIRYLQVRRSDDTDAFVKLLREYNRQRVKSRDQRLREAVLDADPYESYQALLDYRQSRSQVRPSPMVIKGFKSRNGISDGKSPMMTSILQILDDRRRFWPLSDRVVHYALLNSPPCLHTKRPHIKYANTLNCYKGLCDLLTRARLADLIPWEAIADETRPVSVWNVWSDTGAFVGGAINEFLKGYARNLQQSQPNLIEIVAEKNTIAPIITEVAMRYCITVTSGRGYCSIKPRKEMAERFEASGKDKLILLMVSDFDPDGEEIAESFARSMRDDFGIDRIHPIKVALTREQVQKFNLPPVMQAKKAKSKAQATKRAKFVLEQGGANVFEVEAIHPADLQTIVTEAIDSVLDVEAFNAELEAEKKDSRFLAGVREMTMEGLRGLDFRRT